MDALILKEPTSHIYTRTKVPKHLFNNLPPSSFHYYNVAIDVGVVEKDIFSQDVYSTLSRYSEICASQDHIVNTEVKFIKQEGIDVIVSDIPPLASEIGHVAGVPTIAVGNFSWDFIYKPFLQSFPDFENLIDKIRASYEKTDLLLQLPFHHEMTAFPRQQKIPLVVRKCASTSKETRLRLGIRPDDPRSIILVALRLHDVVPLRAIQGLVESDEFIVLSFDPLPLKNQKNVHLLGSHWLPSEFPDIVSTSDLVICKLGYGIVSECIAYRTPLIYITRYDFAEYDVLRNGMKNILPSYLMPKEDFLQGNWYDHIKAFMLNRSDFSDIRIDGAEIAANIILSYTT